LGCKGARGTVRYIGSLEDKKGEWVGVEWDDIDRGKHSGCWKGTRMFFCQKEGNVASFVRREKLQPGIDLLEACALRYLNQGDSLHALKDMQFVGLKGYPAASIGDSTKLSLALSNLKSLDLSCCLLSSWDQIIELGTALSSLYELDISNNTLQDLKEDQIIPPSLFPNLARLIVDTMGENACKNIVKLISAGAFVRLVFLSLQRNCLSDLSILSGKSLGNLQVLNISDNGISSWEQVFKLENFENLKELYLEKNMIREIFPCKNAMLPNLVKLSLNDNPFLSLETLELLDCFPNLQVLDFQRTPLADNLGVRSVRSDLIALLPRLKTVNRSEISDKERFDAEFTFIRNDGRCSHARRAVLRDKYREYVINTKTDRTDQVGLKLYQVSLQSNVDKSQQLIKLTPSLSIKDLKLLISRLFSIEPADQTLFVKNDVSPEETLITQTFGTISDFVFDDNYSILVSRRSEL